MLAEVLKKRFSVGCAVWEYLYLLSSSDSTGTVIGKSAPEMGRYLGKTARAVTLNLRKLETEKMIDVVRNKGRANVFRIRDVR